MGSQLLYRVSQADVKLWSSGERMLAIGRTPVWSETHLRAGEIGSREAAVQERIYAELGRLTGRDLCDRGRLLQGGSSGGGEQGRRRSGTVVGPIASPAEER